MTRVFLCRFIYSILHENTVNNARDSYTLAELIHGAEKSSKPAHHYAVIEDFCSRLEVLPCSAKAAQHYGSIRAALEKTGQTIGVNDLHIAVFIVNDILVAFFPPNTKSPKVLLAQ